MPFETPEVKVADVYPGLDSSPDSVASPCTEQVAIERTSSNPKPKHVREGSTERIRLKGMMHCTIFQEHF